MKMRTCAVAGMFYPRDPSHLEQLLEKFFSVTKSDSTPRGIVAPHAGYVYSGQVAAHAFGAIPSDFSGTFVVRLTPGLHKKTALLAQARGDSLNQFVSDVLAKA